MLRRIKQSPQNTLDMATVRHPLDYGHTQLLLTCGKSNTNKNVICAAIFKVRHTDCLPYHQYSAMDKMVTQLRLVEKSTYRGRAMTINNAGTPNTSLIAQLKQLTTRHDQEIPPHS